MQWSQGDENDGLWNQQSAWVVETKFQPQISWPMLAHLVFWTSIRLTRWKRKRCHQVQDSNRSSETPSLDFRAWDFQSWKPWICWKLSASLDHVRGPGPNISKVLGENKHIHIRYDSYSSVASGYFSSQLTLWFVCAVLESITYMIIYIHIFSRNLSHRMNDRQPPFLLNSRCHHPNWTGKNQGIDMLRIPEFH